MANMAPSFQNGSNMIIRIGSFDLAYASQLAFSDTVNLASVGGIGSMSYDTIEPLSYAAQGSLVITRYTKKAYDAIAGSTPVRASGNGVQTKNADDGNNAAANSSDGNTLLLPGAFNPTAILTSLTFDIEVYGRDIVDRKIAGKAADGLIFVCKDCRFTNYSIDFSPGSLVTERLSFIALQILDNKSGQLALGSALNQLQG